MSFKVGDRVRVVRYGLEGEKASVVGHEGVVKETPSFVVGYWLVELDEQPDDPGDHDESKVWYCKFEELEKLP